MKILTIKVPDAIAAQLAVETQKRGVTTSFIVREALAEYLVTTSVAKGRPNSFLELAHDLCGCISGPEDLSTNLSYMEDYGK